MSGVKEPGPLATGTLQRDQLAGAGIGHGNGRAISRELSVVIASYRQICLGGERGKSPPEARRGVEEQPGLAMIPIAEKGKQRTGKSTPVLSACLGLGNDPRQQHSNILRAKIR